MFALWVRLCGRIRNGITLGRFNCVWQWRKYRNSAWCLIPGGSFALSLSLPRRRSMCIASLCGKNTRRTGCTRRSHAHTTKIGTHTHNIGASVSRTMRTMFSFVDGIFVRDAVPVFGWHLHLAKYYFGIYFDGFLAQIIFSLTRSLPLASTPVFQVHTLSSFQPFLYLVHYAQPLGWWMYFVLSRVSGPYVCSCVCVCFSVVIFWTCFGFSYIHHSVWAVVCHLLFSMEKLLLVAIFGKRNNASLLWLPKLQTCSLCVTAGGVMVESYPIISTNARSYEFVLIGGTNCDPQQQQQKKNMFFIFSSSNVDIGC